MGASLDFAESKLLLPRDSSISLTAVGGDHLSSEWIPVDQTKHAVAALKSTIPTTKVAPSTDVTPNNEEPLEVGGKLFWQLRYHIGHADIPAIKRLCDLSGRKFDVALGRIWLPTCACGRNDRIPQNQIAGRHVRAATGETLLMDVAYPSEVGSQKPPSLITVCPLSRYTQCRFLRDMLPAAILPALLIAWVSIFSHPKTILWGQGRSFPGVIWGQFCQSYDVELRAIPKEAPNQIGACGKQSHLVKLSFRAVRTAMGASWSDSMLLAVTCASRNSCPQSLRQFNPLFIATGRSHFLEIPLGDVKQKEEMISNPFSQRTRDMMLDMQSIMKEHAMRIIPNVQRSTLRTGARDAFEMGDSFSVWRHREKYRMKGYHFLADIGRDLLISKGSKIWEIPRQWTE